ncbi:MAG: DUF3656 domain-containing protein [Planctomycetota bacterium]|nr:DUF3656 domain-containing protein [Planctomycetota bacterium]
MTRNSRSNTEVPQRPPELLAPAGDLSCVVAAVENGADAIYFGLDCGFNARARARNFSIQELPGLVDQLHRRGVSGYVTLNTLLFPSELPDAAEVLRQISEAGVDAVLVQDLGLVRLVRELVPDLPMHASTQMTMTSAECIAEIENLGIQRVVLGRELSIREIEKVVAGTEMPVEVFVHGALCVAYSGQCLTSESLGGRSANRGQCAQACRLPYELVVDGEDRDLGERRYLLSPQDLAAYDLVPDLIRAGVCSLKIEGRLKTPEYVANITRHYRLAIDRAMKNQPVNLDSRQVQEMELSFSRGFSPGWLKGCDHKMLVPADSSAKRGVLLGEVLGVQRNSVTIRSEAPVSRGDGIVFEGDRVAGEEQGGRVYDVVPHQEGDSTTVQLSFGQGAIDLNQLFVGQKIWKTDDPRLNERLRKSFRGKHPVRRRKLSLRVTAIVNQPLSVETSLPGLSPVVLESDEPLQEARKHPLTPAVLREQLGRLGGTAYELDKLHTSIEGQPMLPLSVMGRLRKRLVEALDRGTVQREPRRVFPGALEKLREGVHDGVGLVQHAEGGGPAKLDHAAAAGPVLQVLGRTLEQLMAAAAMGIQHLYADFHDIREYRKAVEWARESGVKLFLATPRIQKPDEYGLFRVMRRYAADGYLVRNLAGLGYFLREGCPVVADFSLNVTNELSALHFRQAGASRLTVSYDLNRQQLVELLGALPKDWVEVVIHQHMPMFHMEHCVFCSVLSPGTNKTNCGRPCDHHLVKLRDRVGMEHPLQADVGCRNTLFNAMPQSAAEVVPDLLEMGVRSFRIELLEETAAGVKKTVGLYRKLLAGQVTGRDVWRELNAANRVGVTRGTLEERRNPLAIL